MVVFLGRLLPDTQVQELHNMTKRHAPSTSVCFSGRHPAGSQTAKSYMLCLRWLAGRKAVVAGEHSVGALACFVKVAALGLEPERHLGRTLRHMQPILHQLNR